MDSDTEIQRRREMAAALGYTIQKDVCTLFNITPVTEENRRRRGNPVASYVVAGNEILYLTSSIAEKLQAGVRAGRVNDAKAAA